MSDVQGATCNGISHTAICSVAYIFGFECNITSSFDVLDYWLETHVFYEDYPIPVIGHVRQNFGHTCKFTKAGHYIVIVGATTLINEEGGLETVYQISDSNSCEEERTYATREEFDECEIVGFISMLPPATNENPPIQVIP